MQPRNLDEVGIGVSTCPQIPHSGPDGDQPPVGASGMVLMHPIHFHTVTLHIPRYARLCFREADEGIRAHCTLAAERKTTCVPQMAVCLNGCTCLMRAAAASVRQLSQESRTLLPHRPIGELFEVARTWILQGGLVFFSVQYKMDNAKPFLLLRRKVALAEIQ